MFIWDRSLDDEDEVLQFAAIRFMEPFEEFVAHFVRQNGIMKMDLGQTGHRTQNYILDAWLGRGGNRDAVAITT